jgi:hypothetical protein
MAEALAERVEVAIDWVALIEEAKKQHVESVHWCYNASGTFITPTGHIGGTEESVCHHYMRKKARFVINGLQDGTSFGKNPGRILPKEVELWFVDYILNRSAYEAVFVEKDAAKALETRLTVVSGAHPGNLVGAACVALRRLWECVYVVRAAYDLVQAGVPEDLAFIIGHTIQAPSNIEHDTQVSWTANLNWHTSIDASYMGFKELKNWMKHKVLTPNGNYVTSGKYDGYSAMYGIGGVGLVRIIRQHFPVHLYKDQPKAVSTNPFAAAKKPVDDYEDVTTNYAKAIEVMAEWAKTYLMENINAA